MDQTRLLNQQYPAGLRSSRRPGGSGFARRACTKRASPSSSERGADMGPGTAGWASCFCPNLPQQSCCTVRTWGLFFPVPPDFVILITRRFRLGLFSPLLYLVVYNVDWAPPCFFAING